VVRSAVSNAEQNPGIDVDTLYVKKAFVDGGPSLKRWTPRAMGRATKILKRTCHITVVLDEK
jgi:large subunit ribosomal protein L22